MNELQTIEPPASLMRHATDVASICKAIVLATACNIQGKKYVKCEGWMAIATAHGCIAGSRDVRKVEGGWTAIGEIRRGTDGVLLSQAEGFVGTGEKRWSTADEYACRAMAQTRAISRACRAAFAHVVVMMDAGLSTTPAEEVPEGGFPDAPRRALPPAPRVPAAQPAATPAPTLASVLAACKAKLLAQPAPVRGAMLRHFVESGQLTDTDTLESLDVETLFPSVVQSESIAANRPRIKADHDAIMAAVQASMDDGQIEGAEIATDGQGQGLSVSAPEPPPGLPPGVQSKRITPLAKSLKQGVGKTGKPWTRHGIQTDAEEWFNTFSQSIADQCEVGRTVTAWFTTTNFGNDLHAITE